MISQNWNFITRNLMLLNCSLLRRMQFLFQESRMFLLLALQDLNVHYLQVLGNSKEAVVQNLSLLVISTQKSL